MFVQLRGQVEQQRAAGLAERQIPEFVEALVAPTCNAITLTTSYCLKSIAIALMMEWPLLAGFCLRHQRGRSTALSGAAESNNWANAP